ncbi:hypothetical protein Tco_0960727 [Tanacetum coccineum]
MIDEVVDEGVPDKKPLYGNEEADTQRAIKESLKEAHGDLGLNKLRKFYSTFRLQRKKALHISTSFRGVLLHKLNPQVMMNLLHCHAGPNPGIQDEGQAGSNPGDAAVSQHQSSHVVHAGPNLEHMDFEVTDTLIQQNPEQMDEEFTTTAYPNVQENLKLPTEDQVRLEEPASSAGTLSSLQNLNKELSFADQFLVEKSQEDEPEKTNTESEVQSMVTVPIHQDTSSVPLMTTPVIDLTVSQPVSTTIQAPLPTSTATRIGELEQHMADMVEANQALEERLDKQGNMLYNLENLDIPHKVSKAVDEIVTDAVDWAIQAPLRDRFRDLPEADMKEILHHRMWESNSYQAHEDHKMLYEALEKSMARDHTDQLLTDLAEARRKKKKRRDSPKTPPGSPPHQPPPPPPPAAASAEYTAWTTTDARLKTSVLSIPEELHMDDDTTHDEQVQSFDDEDIDHDHIPKASALASTYAPPLENSLLPQTGDMEIFMDWFCKKQGITELKQQDLEGLTYEIVNVFHPNVIHLQYQMEECHKLLTNQVDESIIRYNVSKPLPLGGLPGQVKIQSDFFFNKDLEYLRYGRKSGRPALSISKMKAAYYLDVGLEQMVPDQIHKSEGDRRAVRTHMRIISVVRIEVFSLYGYDYMKTIVLRRADLIEYTIVEMDFKYLYPSDFEYLYLLNLQGHLNHLPPEDKKILTTAINLWTRNLVIRQRVEDFQLGIESYQTQLNLTKPQWDATGFEFKHDFTIDEALDYRVKEFQVNRINLGLNTRFWTRKDVDRSKEFMFAIQKRIKTMIIFQNLESFVGGRIRDGDYRLLKRTE